MIDANVHFVANPVNYDDLHTLQNMRWEDGTVACTRHTWIWPLYCQLKMRGCSVSIDYKPRLKAINVVHCQTARRIFSARDFLDYYMVGIRADFRPFPYGQIEIVQNRKSEGKNRIYMPLYPQPGLIPRDTQRSQVENICFAGREQNSARVSGLEKELNKLGCRFVFKGIGKWHEMSDVDILLGIRSFDKAPHHSKPPTKMFNAWGAGIPFIGGYDSAFKQVGVPGENYLRVSTPYELIESIKALKTEPSLYNKLVENGKKAYELYSPSRITDLWIELFCKQIIPDYEQWSRSRSLSRNLSEAYYATRFFLREVIMAKMVSLMKGT